eukprot:Phypoly_transcript_20920.p1 GENE.Phypoly_transcript_20920~~Phypoly_transcript_20920.p1  ORF type:complete len:187 (+),score=9.28 Phypoly_transcript_20920:48-608(+)
MPSEHLDCPLCLEPFSHATTTSCGHCFCAPCILEYWNKKGRSSKVTCPIDRKPISLLIPNYVLRKEVSSQLRQHENSSLAAQYDREIETYNTKFAHQPQTVTESIREDWAMLGLMRAGNFFHTILVYATLILVLLYLFFPFDLIPDELGLVGYVDDFAFLIGAIWFIRYLIHVYRDSLIQQVGHSQ